MLEHFAVIHHLLYYETSYVQVYLIRFPYVAKLGNVHSEQLKVFVHTVPFWKKQYVFGISLPKIFSINNFLC